MKKLLIVALLFCGFTAQAQERDRDEVVGLFIFNIMKYMQWPDMSGDFNVNVAGYQKVADYMTKYYGGKQFQGHNTVIATVPKGNTNFSGVEAYICHKNAPVQHGLLSVTIDDDNLSGMVNFVTVIEGDVTKIKVKIKKKLAEDNGFKISATLTSMIQIIE